MQLTDQPNNTSKRKNYRLSSPRIDMTPMVDLGFLLITFFIFTTTMGEQHAMPLVVPTMGDITTVPQSKAMTLLLGQNNEVFAYDGLWEEAQATNTVRTTNYETGSGLGKLIRDRQNKMKQTKKDGSDDLVLLIKPSPGSSYKNVIDALDEMLINKVKRYAIVEITPGEKAFLERN